MIKENNNCKNHIDEQYLFYCFDDKSFLCEECFRAHRSHKIEIRADLKKVSDFIQLLKQSNFKNIKSIYENIEKKLKELKDEFEKLLLEVQKLSGTFKDNEEIKMPDDINNMKYEDFENFFNCIEIKSKVKNIPLKGISFLNKINNDLKLLFLPTNFKYINKEVSVINNSKVYSNFTVDILLGKSTQNSYCLFDQNKEHFLILDLNKKYFLKSIRIQVTKDDCSLKNFIVFIKETNSDNENWLKIDKFIKKRETQNNQYETFEIGFFCRQVKFIFIDAWGINSGNYILIKTIDFEVGE